MASFRVSVRKREAADGEQESQAQAESWAELTLQLQCIDAPAGNGSQYLLSEANEEPGPLSPLGS